MPRGKHKEGCQCAVCRKVRAARAKAQTVPMVAPKVSAGVLVRSLKRGAIFESKDKRYKVFATLHSRNVIGREVYTRYGTYIMTESALEFNPSTLVKVISE